MKLNYHKLFSTLALAGVFAFNASAETISEVYTIDFSQMEDGFKLNSFWGGKQDKMALATAPDGTKAVFISGVTVNDGVEATNEAGYPAWNTKARYEALTLPAGFNFSHVQMIEVNWMPTQPDNILFGIQIKGQTNFLTSDAPSEVNKWTTLAFDPTMFTTEDGSAAYTGKPGSFDFCMGADGSTNYYIKDVTFYLEKEVTQREIDEEKLDKKTAACISIDFDNLEANPAGCEFLGSNGGSTNRPDMIIDKGPADYNNNCAHIIYGGYTNIFIWNLINAPEGYTFDDLRLVEYDIYETEEAGVDHTNGNSFPGKNGAPVLKIKDAPWSIDSNANGSDCGNAPVEVNKWSHVEFRPSAINWAARDFSVTEGEGDDAVTTPVHWEADQTRDEMGKLSKFNISIGFFPCLNQCYVDNVKLWFQKSSAGSESGIENVVAPAEEGYTVYNLQGILVLKTMDRNAVGNLPAGLYIVNGKKYIIK